MASKSLLSFYQGIVSRLEQEIITLEAALQEAETRRAARDLKLKLRVRRRWLKQTISDMNDAAKAEAK